MTQKFTPEGYGLQIFKERYAIHENESWEDACLRVAGYLASAEEGANIPRYKEAFLDILSSGRFMPGGRIWYGAGRKKGNMLNCYVIPIGDSKEGWGQALYDSTVISCTGGGVGMNGSAVRPSGAKIAGHGGESTGPLSIFKMINAIGNEIKAGGVRRVALMQCLNHNHPNIVEFLNAKLDLAELTNANISMVFMDESPEDFFHKVDNNQNVELKFGDVVYGKVSARELWTKVLENAFKSGEPGILNGWYANQDSNIRYDTKLISTNPCGEIWLSEYENCCLGALVLSRFVNERGELDWDALRETIHVAVRFLDNVLTMNYYPLKANEDASKKYRRIGLGIMGLHDMLIRMGIRYSEGYATAADVMRFIRNEAYLASIAIAAEKGSFPKFDANKVLQSPSFASKLPARVKNMIKQYGLRNCAILTIAPTGTTSIVQGVTSGIEPMFAAGYIRRYYKKGQQEKAEEVIFHPMFVDYHKAGRDVAIFEGAHDLTPMQHIKMQSVCQQYVDNAVSKTINIPKNMDPKQFDDALRYAAIHCKGTTVYPSGSREGEPLTPLPLDVAILRLSKEQDANTDNMDGELDQACATGVCEVPWAK